MHRARCGLGGRAKAAPHLAHDGERGRYRAGQAVGQVDRQGAWRDGNHDRRPTGAGIGIRCRAAGRRGDRAARVAPHRDRLAIRQRGVCGRRGQVHGLRVRHAARRHENRCHKSGLPDQAEERRIARIGSHRLAPCCLSTD
ncbi:hypothetical protein RSPO_c01139 [Ralstonia solanacearum Po82]|uniref:Uncharacterized protein n=1 Tax=Ralstonia solanacearum (strain Po82) TaxID=1031711 RepID=F6FZS8_RALS8|nr:hypothetical protein RSPO_c01139 [Ralstonia solanacearum Po82]